jgi:glutamate--cysteine ligase catalytic subunit
MGLLTDGTPLHWDEAKKHAEFIRMHGIKQFLAIYRQCKDRTLQENLWGDEVRWPCCALSYF